MNPHGSETSMQALRNLSDLRLAVLIDADNISYSHINNMMVEVTRYGTPTFKRIYGDWTQPNLAGWKNVLLDYAITPIQQYSYTKGKNASDSALIIDAMDILYSGKVDGFCIVSSDSDFTRLAIRLREAGMRVIGMGEKKTPKPFITACDRFIFIEVLSDNADQDEDEDSGSASAKSAHAGTESQNRSKSPKPVPAKKRKPQVERHIKKMLHLSVSDVADEDGWAFLGEVGNMILKKEPSFDPRNYGFTKLTPLLKDLNMFEFDERSVKGSNVRHIYIRDKHANN
ncbi:MAG: NYN domain-containing protein [Candidatus Cyclonatronum sp.]|uniref:NYN domain-containing protein n=1 Tax=Cyclonatronum sp. TaxID=3024185 RepID=UPI0025BE876D|nr:NYN domain-containing protein [Cyclonatronum sp.]MCH8486539.1 NYN domain-containing protein [Cyclonatronum sp.]